MLVAFTILLLFQCLGEGIAFLFGLPVPGPVVGMLALMVTLVFVPSLGQRIEEGAQTLLSHLGLLFVPAGVGIIVSAASGNGHWLAIIASLLVSTVLALLVTGLILKRAGAREAAGEHE